MPIRRWISVPVASASKVGAPAGSVEGYGMVMLRRPGSGVRKPRAGEVELGETQEVHR